MRSLGVVFGASHLAVATVLAVYMGGQALGSAILGNRADRSERPLRLYGLLEIGVAISAVAFLALMRVYPALYGPLARISEEQRAYLTVLRTAFALAALILPTTLMGGTLPVMTRFIARRDGLGRQLSLLYAFNTLGAVAGSLLAGFVLLRTIGVTATVLVAATVSAAVGIAAVLLQRRAAASPASPVESEPSRHADAASDVGARWVLVGIGISGFCALGYEVLWTRILTLVVGTSVYSFTVMLVAFLAGIGLGSHAFGLVRRLRVMSSGRGAVLVFGATQILIGVAALGVIVLMRDLPTTADRLHAFLRTLAPTEFRLVAAFAIAFGYMFVPAFFMGLAFPVAGAASAGRGSGVGAAVGRVLTANTVGAIAGSVVTGFGLIYAFGIERSSQMLVVVNVAIGAAIALGTVSRRAMGPVLAAGALLLGARAAYPDWGRAWDQRFFASYTNSGNGRTFATPERIREHLRQTEILYYHEGVNETVSVIRQRGDVAQAFIVNGRPEASNAPMDVQIQRGLGHIPLLLHPNPRRVFVLGTGSGMTLGATAIHESVERVVLGEIEEGALGVARTFREWNHGVLDNPKLKIVFNDGRNHLATTREKFDVITADPIHPWSGGAAYLYTLEYFRSMASRLAPGGIVSQWLPLYELSTHDLQTVVRTFCEGFPHVMLWVTYYDAELIGSNDPIVIDEAAVSRRMAVPAIRDDLASVHMGPSAEDLLAYFMMGDAGARAFGQGGDVNTDDNLVLEFSAPASQGITTEYVNVRALSAHRESLLPYLAPAAGEERRAQVARWTRLDEVGRVFDRAHALFLEKQSSPALIPLYSEVERQEPGYAPLHFLLDEKQFWERIEPALVADALFEMGSAPGGKGSLRISAVRQFVGRGRVLVSFVDNARREIYGQRYLYGKYDLLEGETARYIGETLRTLRSAAERATHSPHGPQEDAVSAALREEAGRVVGQIPEPGDG